MKPGIKTTEFWICLIASAVIGALGYPQEAGIPWAIPSLAVIAAGYAAFRSSLKAKNGGQ